MSDVDSLSPHERELMDLLGSEPYHGIVQTILGHPEALASVDEINHFAPSHSRDTVEGAIGDLVDADILAAYGRPLNRDEDLPTTFFGFTEYGIELLGEFNYLNGVPATRAIYEATEKPKRIQRHQTAPRPSLPDAVQAALRF